MSYALVVPGENSVLEPEEWFATAVPPIGPFASGGPRAAKVQLAIAVPEGYRAFTTGEFLGARRSSGRMEYHYKVESEDFDPFLLIGKYHEEEVAARHHVVVFWTLDPLDPGCARAAAEHLAATLDVYESIFGELWKKPPAIPVIQVSGSFPLPIEEGSRGVRSVPGGIMTNLAPAEICGQEFFPLADRGLAGDWFGRAIRPKSETQPLLGFGARAYAELVAEARSGGSASRARQVAQWLAEYSRLRSTAEPLPPTGLGLNATPEQRRMAGIQSALFYVALEDQYGPEAVQRAMADLVGSLRGGSVGIDELRSALERESGGNLYDFFQQWLNHPGIPGAFRSRYQATQTGLDTSKDSSAVPRRVK
jgi:hypothetical protein